MAELASVSVPWHASMPLRSLRDRTLGLASVISFGHSLLSSLEFEQSSWYGNSNAVRIRSFGNARTADNYGVSLKRLILELGVLSPSLMPSVLLGGTVSSLHSFSVCWSTSDSRCTCSSWIGGLWNDCNITLVWRVLTKTAIIRRKQWHALVPSVYLENRLWLMDKFGPFIFIAISLYCGYPSSIFFYTTNKLPAVPSRGGVDNEI